MRARIVVKIVLPVGVLPPKGVSYNIPGYGLTGSISRSFEVGISPDLPLASGTSDDVVVLGRIVGECQVEASADLAPKP